MDRNALRFHLRIHLSEQVLLHDFSTDNAIGKSILTCIIGTVDKIIAFYGIKIDEITDQSHKYNDKKE